MRLGNRMPSGVPTPWRRPSRTPEVYGDGGFTLIEMIIVALVIPIIIGAITLALMSVFSLQSSVSTRLSDSNDAQIVSANFEKDVEGAAFITTASPSTSPSVCESTTQVASAATQVLGLEWGSGATTAMRTEVSYVEVPVSAVGNSPATNSMFRNVCQIGSTTPITTTVVSSNVPTGQTATVTCSIAAASECSGATNYSNSWVSAAGITGVTFAISEPESKGTSYSYTLAALPGASSPANGQSTVSNPNSSCGFATPGTGTYDTSLCFVDFAGYSQPGSGCQTLSAPIANTPYTMTFCVTVTGTSVQPHAIPTYFAPPTSEAFLGNNGFYTGIPGDPALYQTGGGTSTVTITNIQVLDSNGNPASGWELATGDAESTDAGESMTWAAGWSAQSTVPAANQNLNLLWNSSTSAYGNACAYTTDPGGVDLTGLGTQSVTCAANISSDKTGTVMLEAEAPNSLTVTMYGSGLEAMFLGLLLP